MMRLVSSFRFTVLAAGLTLALTACGTSDGASVGATLDKAATPTAASIQQYVRSSPRPESTTPQDSAYQKEAVIRLHEQKLITIPAIQEKTTETVTLYRGGTISREEASRRLNNWLDEYIRTHPAEIAALEARFAKPTTPAGR